MEYKEIEEWEEADLEELAKLKKTRGYSLLKMIFEGETDRLKEEALMGRPTKAQRSDAWQSGFRQGEFVGMERLINAIRISEELLDKKEFDNK